MLKRRWLGMVLPWTALVVLGLALEALPATAADVVVPPPCDEAAFDTALAAVQASGGGTLTFNCGDDATVLLASAKVISSAVTIDGAGEVTLSGQASTRLFEVAADGQLSLSSITLRDGFAAGNGGAILNDIGGTLEIANSRFISNAASLAGSGGAIVSYGPLTITASLFEGNSAANGGALFVRYAPATTTVTNTVFRFNQTTSPTDGWGGAILTWDGAAVTINGGEIFGNTARTGGGIYNHAAAAYSTVEMRAGTVLSGNIASADGGGIYNAGVLTLTAALLDNNSAYRGAGLYHDGPQATLTDITFRDNSASGGGGGLFSNSGDTRLTNVEFGGNMAAFRGGGIYNHSLLTYLRDVTLDGNSVNPLGGVGAWGGGIFSNGSVRLENVSLKGNSANYGSGGGLFNLGTASLTNVTLSGNSASYYGGGIGNGSGSATLSHVTLSGNIAGVGGGGISVVSGTLAASASVVAASPSGGNCGGPITNLGFNLSTDSTCGFNSVADMLLGPLADNGGPTQTHLPLPGSPAIDFVAVGCPPPDADQRGAARPVDGDGNGTIRCDAGAVEYGPALIYVPLILR